MKFFNTFDFIENFFPSTPIAFLIFLFSFFLITTIFILMIAKLLQKEKKEIKEIKNKPKKLTIDDLINIASNDKSNINDLYFVLKYFNEKFKIKDYPDKSLKFFKLVLNHKNRSKILFDVFHNETIKLNKEFKKQLDEIESKSLR